MNDINILFDRIQIINTKDPGDLQCSDIDALVEFFRYRRTRKATLTKDHDTASLDTIMPAPKPTTIVPGAVRRFIKL